jgi:hypothetical protein
MTRTGRCAILRDQGAAKCECSADEVTDSGQKFGDITNFSGGSSTVDNSWRPLWVDLSHSGGIAVKDPDAVHQETLKDRLGSSPSGRAIKKPPFRVILQPMSGNRSTAAAAGSAAE